MVAGVSVLGVGIDLVELQRVREMLGRRRDQALGRFLTDHEREYVESREDPVPPLSADAPTLVIRGAVLMGGLAIKP